jgi:acyl-CoA dehydrogenase
MKNISLPDKQTLIADFAARHVATRPDLQTHPEFPMDLWRKMGEAGLFKTGIAKHYGGAGGGFQTLLRAGETFVQYGYNPGLAVSWLYQQMIAHHIIGSLGTSRQKRDYLPALAEGKLVLSFAVSEPGHGARPGMLETSAVPRGKYDELNGEKTYLTNGPIADIFIVVAVTDNTAAKKRFTAFIVPREAPGLIVGPPLILNFLKPSTHGGIKLNHCIAGPNAVVGQKGNAWTDMVVPFGEIEDVVMMGPALGGMAAQMDMLIALLRNAGATLERERLGQIGNLHAQLTALRLIAYEAANRLDGGIESPVPLVITFAQLAAWFQTSMAQNISCLHPAIPDPCNALHRDMDALVTFRKKLLDLRREKIGAALLRAPSDGSV